MRYRPDLDGIRALAVLAVIASHTNIGHASGGWMGVDVFFVLSGYLITALLLNERTVNGTVSLSRFYTRRALRLYPALLLMILIALPFASKLGGFGAYGRSALLSALYVQDFSALGWFPAAPFTHTWSLAIEEQFYVLWPPLLLWLLARGRDPVRWAGAAAVAGWIALAISSRAPNAAGIPTGYFLPWTRFPQILVGCCVALLLARRSAPTWIGRGAAGWIIAAAMAALVIVAGGLYRIPHLGWEAPVIALLTAALLVHLNSAAGGVQRALAWPPLSYLGRRSYGIYLYHLPVLLLLEPHTLRYGKLQALAIELPVILAIAIVSYRFVELPFLRLKHRRFEPPSHRPEPVPT